MADLSQLERALINADAAGDVQAATMLAAEIKKQRSAPVAKDSSVIGDVVAGAVKGASDIGATLLTPIDYLAQKVGISNDFIGRNDRREAVKSTLANAGADTDSMAFKGGELAADIAGTAGAGGLIAKGLGVIPGVASKAPALLNSIRSGGMTLGKPAAATMAGKAADLATRTAGGAVLGGVSSAMIDPETAGSGAAIGAVLPGGMQTAGMIWKGAKQAAGSLAKNILGASTGVGSDAIGAAVQAGKQGNRVFLDNMRRKVDMTEVLDDAKNALNQMRAERGAEYRAGMAGVTADKSVLDFAPVIKSADDAMADTMFNGVVKKENAAKMAQKIQDVVSEWGGLDPAKFHTPEGLDALKQRIGDLRDASAFGTPERRVADQVYNAVKRQITDQAPGYAKVMKSYSEASELIGEIERALSLGEKASADTAMRKLQSLMRNNVNTNYGNRMTLASELSKRGGENILPAVAGQAMSSATPRGLQGLAATGTGLYSLSNPAALAALPFQSPRVVGELAYGLGQGAGKVNSITQGLLGGPAVSSALADPMTMGLLSVAPTMALSR